MQTGFYEPSSFSANHGFFFGTSQGGPGGKPPGPSATEESFSVPTEESVPTGQQGGPNSPPPSELQ